jgi:hypothetical protein
MALIDAPRDVVFVHGVQWQRDFELKGYSRPNAGSHAEPGAHDPVSIP